MNSPSMQKICSTFGITADAFKREFRIDPNERLATDIFDTAFALIDRDLTDKEYDLLDDLCCQVEREVNLAGR